LIGVGRRNLGGKSAMGFGDIHLVLLSECGSRKRLFKRKRVTLMTIKRNRACEGSYRDEQGRTIWKVRVWVGIG
jgi:hypothetical protein